MFWKKNSGEQGKLTGPKEIPELVGRHMVVQMQLDPDRVWRLRAVVRDIGKKQFYCRVFEDATVAKANVQVKDWSSLDGHPDLVLWEGFVDKDKMIVRPEKFVPAAASNA